MHYYLYYDKDRIMVLQMKLFFSTVGKNEDEHIEPICNLNLFMKSPLIMKAQNLCQLLLFFFISFFSFLIISHSLGFFHKSPTYHPLLLQSVHLAVQILCIFVLNKKNINCISLFFCIDFYFFTSDSSEPL